MPDRVKVIIFVNQDIERHGDPGDISIMGRRVVRDALLEDGQLTDLVRTVVDDNLVKRIQGFKVDGGGARALNANVTA